MRHQVMLCLGANKDAKIHIQKAQQLLQKQLPGFRFSETMWTDPVGIDSSPFLNCVGWGETEMAYDELRQFTKKMERNVGDRKYLRAKGIINLDIDILLYDGQKYHSEDWEREYIQVLTNKCHE